MDNRPVVMLNGYDLTVDDIVAVGIGDKRVGLDARAVERYSVMAETFAHLPAATNDLAANLRWLHEADPEGQHRDFFTGLLRRADETLAVYFREKGVRRGAEVGAEERIVTAVAQYQAGHPGTEYRVALDAVLAERPELEAEYSRGGVK